MAYTTLRYPNQQIGADYDYMMFEIVEYSPNRLGEARNGIGFNFTGGAASAATQINAMGSILLPMPENINDTNSVSWESDSLDSLSAKALNTGMKAVDEANLSASKKRLEAAGKSTSGFAIAVEAAKGGLGAGAEGFGQAVDALADPRAKAALKAKFVADAVNVFGANINAGNILSRTTGQVLNPNMELLFKGVNLRSFNYSFSLTPRDRSEAQAVKAIINTFKRRMAAKKNATGGNADGVFIKAPDIFRIKFMSGGDDHPFLYKLKPCALKNMNVTYTDGTPYMTYADATPVKMRMNLSFQEMEPVYSEDYDQLRAEDGVGF